MKKIVKYIGFMAGFLLIGVLVFCGYLYFVILDDPFDNRDFDSEIWLKYHEDMEPDNPRGEMYEDLVENYLIKGMSKAEVFGLLGQPDFQNTEDMMSYNLGMWSGMRIDYDSLDLKFTDDGGLVEFYRVQH